MSDFLDAALSYADLGYLVFPTVAGAKRPLTPNGLLDATTDWEQIEAWWTAQPQANIAISTAGLLVVDLDTIDGEPNPWLKDQPERLIDLAAGCLSLTPRGGKHYIFRQPPGREYRNTAGKLAPHVDTRATGGYILVPPSVVDGKTYKWGGDALDVRIDRLQLPPGWLLDLLDGRNSTPSTRSNKPLPSNAIPDGQRNQTLTSLAGSMRRNGLAENEIAAALHEINSSRCNPPLPANEVDTIAWSIAHYEPDQISVAVAENHYGQMFDDDSAEIGPPDPGAFPEQLLSPPGFLTDVIEFNHVGANKPQPVLALAGALSLLATLTGRKLTDSVGTRTNLYCLGVCETAGGKERARKVNKAILYQSGLEDMIGPESIASSSGLVNITFEKLVLLFQIDEIGRYLKTANDPRNSFLYNIATVLLKLFTSSDDIYVGDALADTKNIKKIYQPHVCLYGTTVPQSLYDGLTIESLTDGFLSRMLIFEGQDGVTAVNPEATPTVPASILERARWWGEYRAGTGNLWHINPTPTIVDISPAAAEVFADLAKQSEVERIALGEPLGSLWTRSTEKAHKLALLYSASAEQLPLAVTAEAAEWARSVIEYLTRRTVYLASRWISISPYDAKVKRVMRIIEAAGPAGATSTAINNRTGMPARERGEILIDVLTRGLAQRLDPPSTGAGRPSVRYVAAKYAANPDRN